MNSTPAPKPTDLQLRIAIALHQGAQWRTKTRKGETNHYLTFVTGKGTDFSYGGVRISDDSHYTTDHIHHWLASDIPNYPVSLDACAKFEATMEQEIKESYAIWLYAKEFPDAPSLEFAYHMVFQSPQQRCLAYITTFNLSLP